MYPLGHNVSDTSSIGMISGSFVEEEENARMFVVLLFMALFKPLVAND